MRDLIRANCARPGLIVLVGLAIGTIFTPAAVTAQTATTAGEFFVDPPTLVSLGFEWRIAGDDNRNAKVEVTYRKKGEREWHKALPLLRLQHEQVPGGLPRDGAWWPWSRR